MKNCPYCGSAGDLYFRIFARIFHKCRECDLIYKNVKEDYNIVLATYSREDYFNIYACDQTDRKRNKLYEHILNSIEENKGTGSLLDVGTGCGFFLTAAKKRGYLVKGVEPSRQSVEVACRQNKLDVFCGTLQELSSDSQFDIITFINVLDHSAEPWREIKLANDLLKSGGILYLRFPNGFLHTSLYKLASKFGLDDRISTFLVFHQFSFTPRFIQRLLEDSRFSEISVVNSPPSEGDPHRLFSVPAFSQYVKKAMYLIAQVIRFFSFGKIMMGTSLEVVAVRRVAQEHNIV